MKLGALKKLGGPPDGVSPHCKCLAVPLSGPAIRTLADSDVMKWVSTKCLWHCDIISV